MRKNRARPKFVCCEMFVLDLLGLGLCAFSEVGSRGLAVQARLAVEESTAFLGGAAGLQVAACRGLSIARCRRSHVRNLLGVGVLAADLGDTDI